MSAPTKLAVGAKVRVAPLKERAMLMAPWAGREGVVRKYDSDIVEVLLDKVNWIRPSMVLAGISPEAQVQRFDALEIQVI